MKITNILTIGALSILGFVACAQEGKKEKHVEKASEQKAIPQKEASLEMSQDTIDARVVAEMEAAILAQKAELTAEALATLAQTENLLYEIAQGKNEEAIRKGKELIGDLEVLLAKDPSLALLPVDVTYDKQELVTDIVAVREGVKAAKIAMEKGYYREASDILDNLRSEMVVNTFLIPTATYPDALRESIVLLEAGDTVGAVVILEEMLGTVVIEKSVIPLPIMYAEQMIIEAATIDAENHDRSEIVLNLLSNADYQLQLAQELGYGKKDKDFKDLAEAIKVLKESVTKKEDSSSKFDELKQDLKKFKEKIIKA